MKQSIGSDALYLTISQTITLTITMITAMLLSRFLSLQEFGTYSQLMIVINLFTVIFMLGLPNSINYFLARAESINEKNNFLSVYFTLSTFLSFLTGLVLVINMPLIINYFSNPIIKNFFYTLAILPWAKITISSIQNILIVSRKTKSLLVFKILHSVMLVVIILIVGILNLGFSTYMLLFVIIEGIFAISVYAIVIKTSGKINLNIDRATTNTILKFSVPIGLASAISTLNIQLDKLVIGRFFSTEEIAVYANAARELPVTIVASGLIAVLLPQLVRLLKKGEKEEAVSLWGVTINLAYIVICFVSLALVIFAPEVITILYSDKYLPGVSVFRVYSLVLLLRFTYFGIVLNATGNTKIIFYSSLLSLGLNLILNYVFYLMFGFIGPALATLASILLMQLFQLIITVIIMDVKFKSIFPWKNIAFITLVNLAMGAFFAFLKYLLPLHLIIGGILESVILGFTWFTIYSLIMSMRIKEYWLALKRPYPDDAIHVHD